MAGQTPRATHRSAPPPQPPPTPPPTPSTHPHTHTRTPTHQCTNSQGTMCLRVPLCGLKRMDAMAADRVGAAKRRRERRLRQFLRHERLSDGLGSSPTSLCSQKCWARDARSRTGTEHCQGSEAAGSPMGQSRSVTWLPRGLSSWPSMAGGDNIDGSTLRFLLEHCLAMKKLLEEEERRKQEEKEKEKAQRVAKEMKYFLSSPWAQNAAARFLGEEEGEAEEEEKNRGERSCRKPPPARTWTIWTLYEPLVSGTHLFGACHARGAQENLEFFGRRIREVLTTTPYTWLSLVRCASMLGSTVDTISRQSTKAFGTLTSSSRCRARVVSSLLVALLRYFVWLIT